MSLTNKLINPTPFEAPIPYERGIVLKVPADGELELTVNQMDDFRDGKPGSEEVRKLMNYHGLFLNDTDKSYDSQALKALQESKKSKKQQYDEHVSALRREYAAIGRPLDDEAFQEHLAMSGYGKLAKQIEALDKRIKFLSKEVQKDPSHGIIKDSLDPDRTCFVTEPPRQFPSKVALQMFLEENPEIKAKHEEMSRQMNNG